MVNNQCNHIAKKQKVDINIYIYVILLEFWYIYVPGYRLKVCLYNTIFKIYLYISLLLLKFIIFWFKFCLLFIYLHRSRIILKQSKQSVRSKTCYILGGLVPLYAHSSYTSRHKKLLSWWDSNPQTKAFWVFTLGYLIVFTNLF